MSMFRYGTFATYTDTSLGRITYRPQYAQSFTLTPAIDLYPTILPGQGTGVCSTERIKAGESFTLPAVGGGNTNIYIPASDYIRDIGDLRTLAVDSAAGSMSVAGKRLQKLKLGDPDASTVTSTLTGLTIGACPSLTEIDARNVTGLTETIDLTNCPRIKSAYFGGTDVKSVVVPSGAKIANLQLSDATTTISLVDLPKLSSEGLTYGKLSNVEYLRIEDCPNLDAFGMLKELYNLESKSLRNIRVIGFVYDGDATDVDMVMNLAKDIAADGSTVDYTGIDSEGTPQQTLIPIIEGTLNIAGSVYADSAEFVREQYPNLVLNVTGGYYIRFADKAVQVICVANWGDGIGITEAQAAAVTTIGTKFKGNTEITSFNELEKFTGLTSIYGRDNVHGNVGAFENCTSLKQVTLPLSVTSLGGWCFQGCTALETIENLEQIITIGAASFKNCTSLKKDLYFPNLTALNLNGSFSNYQYFVNSGITGFFAPNLTTGQASSDGGNISWFNGCTGLKRVNLGKVDAIASRAFMGCSSLEEVLGIQDVVTIGPNAFYGCANLIQDIELPKCTSILSTGNYGNSSAFGKSGITSLSIPLVSSVGIGGSNNNGFCSLCPNLTRVEFGNVLTVIGAYAFQGCSALSECYIPSGVIEIGSYAFYNCTSLEIADLSLPNLESLGSNAFNGVKISKVSNLGKITTINPNIGDKSVLREITLPNTIKTIENQTFYGYSALETITIEEGASGISVGSGAFQGLSSLVNFNVDFSAFVSIGAGAFSGISLLNEVIFPNVTTIYHQAFRESSISKIKLPSIETMAEAKNYDGIFSYCPNLVLVDIGANCTSIGWQSFGRGIGTSGKNLTVIVRSTTPPSLGGPLFGQLYTTFSALYVPDDSVDAYKAATNWSQYQDRIKPLSEYVE